MPFLNGDLEEEVFMSLPPGFEDKFGQGKVCRLKKSMYGLKQSPRAWFECFERIVKDYGYCQSQADHTMFYKHTEKGKLSILIVYVDDIIMTGDDIEELAGLKKRLADNFEIKDLGALKYFLGMEFARSKEDWAGSTTDRRSTSGYCTFVGENLVTWRSKKQCVVARSGTEAEFRSLAHGICEVIWIKRLLEDLKIYPSLPLRVYCDNKAAISIAHNPVLHDRTKHIEDGRVNALYSTPSIYTDAKYATNQSWPIKTDDFFPYADRENAYWTGYFTSRPALKRYIRVLSGYYMAARQLEFFKGRSKSTNTDSLGDALAIVQHHDAVTGTEKQHVANDYAKRLSIGYKECPLLNVSYCPASEVQLSQGKILIVVIYNSLGWKREEVIQIPVISEDVIVHNSEGKEIESQLLPLVDTYVSLRNYYVKAYSGQTPVQTPKYWLAFLVSVPPLGFSSYVISNAKRPGSGSTKSSVHTFQIIESSTVEVGHGNLKLTFSRDHGKLTNYINSQSSVEETVKQSYVFYTGYNGTNDKAPQNAGAYIFRPNGTFLIKPEEEVSSTIMRGPITDEVHQRINPWIYQVTRLHKGKEHVEVEYIVGPIPINDGTGKDVVTQVMTNVDSNKTFYTDSNGRDFIKRIRDYRADWDLKVNQPVAGNYYPLNLGIYIQDDKKEFSVLVDRPVGGSSIVDGQIELMLHRRLLLDDSRGVAEALNETVCIPNDCKGLIIQGKLYYRIDPRGEGAKWRRSFGQEIYSPLLFAFSEQEGDNWINSHRPTFSWIDSSYSLPENVAIITLQELDGGKVLLRLAHLYEIGEDKDLSVLTNVELKKLFPRKKISKVTETSLTANQERIEMEKKRLVWKVEGPSSQNDAEVKRGRPVDPAALIVELVPMEIRTFIIQFVSNPLSSI
ncbi:Lysosomal alpha-mannosidase [Morus notabilis]|uniref:Lysosomal alpha-mannosidase n=1 Tax=Morus notabilis TaxID=981085 RepID=W9R0K3_9ROSA|nr:Lysosomal alpha-mannosidase [Morus notabilis]